MQSTAGEESTGIPNAHLKDDYTQLTARRPAFCTREMAEANRSTGFI